jgi:hypothetical protein
MNLMTLPLSDGGDGEHVPEECVILAVVEELAAEAPTELDGVVDLGDLCHINVEAL